MRLAIFASVKSGLEPFIYREICEFADRGVAIRLFPTKHGSGLYNPRSDWEFRPWRWWSVLWSQPWRLARGPWRYLSVLMEAIRFGAIVDFLLAAHFAGYMKGVDALYATFGDRKLFIGYFCKRLSNIPLSVEIHAYELYQNPNPALFRTALRACDRIIAATQYNREILRDRFDIPEQRVDVVRYALDLDEYRPATKFVVLIVAFFVEKKGHEILFQAVKKMGRDDVEIWVVGGLGNASRSVDVEAMVKQFEMESQVAFFGKLRGTALKAVYHACDVFCLPSRFDRQGDAEGFPNVIIEAMACGKPVVTTRHVEIPLIVEQIVVEPNDVDALADALEQVYLSPALRRELGARNRALAAEYFSNDNILRKIRLFHRIVSPSLPPGADQIRRMDDLTGDVSGPQQSTLSEALQEASSE